MAYSLAVSAYLERIDGLLKDGTDASLLYAALELRCGVEARMKEYLEPLEHIPKSQKKEWAIAKLARSIEKAFRVGDKIMIFTVRSHRLDTECTLMYTPVSSRLQEVTNRLGVYLHFPKDNSVPDPTWWNHLRELICEGYGELLLANSGELIGLPLLHKPTGRINVRAVIPNGDPRENFIAELVASGEAHVINVQYIEPRPGKKIFGIDGN
ncbi:hypothetical protein C8R32_11123 [Nitrosospira sp. Nsp5]|uniref:Uncharacterized protein n=1 Tax=Nitrosospira multiformis TaxID=1231 RepID=A0ABY0TBK3_9PROT|nr:MULTISPECIES: hypothetical protein [Nitrosospira]PTR06309.1 hypothetical protein C8R32_11123 [Nitrosospira sp. Nsp5]SDQ58330.1 hypothetical protein SAMN05216402_1420 [Nitrosospira multiformis]